MLFYGTSISHRSLSSHDHAMDVLAKRVLANNQLRQAHCLWPVGSRLGYSSERFQQSQILFAVIGALLLDPLLITSLHKLAPVKRQRSIKGSDTVFKLSRPPRIFTFGQQLVELFDVDAVRKLRIELVVAVTVKQEVLFEWLVTIQGLAYV